MVRLVRTAIMCGIVSFAVPFGAHAQGDECSDSDPCAYAQGVPGQVYDSDWDGVSDSSESYWGMNPYNADTDNDGIQDGAEYNDL